MSERRTTTIVGLVLLALTVGLFALNYSVPFVYDDVQQIQANMAIWDFFDWDQILHDPVRPNRVIQNLSLALNWTISPGKPWSFHLLNDLLHGTNAILLYLFLGAIGVRNRGVRIFTTLVFFLHPLQVEGSTYIMGRIELLKTAVTLSALLYYLSPRKNKALLYAGLVLSLLVKETCVLTPLLFIALDLTVRGLRPRELNYKEHALYLSHGVWMFLISHLLTLRAHYNVVGFDLYPFGDYILSNLHYLAYYFYLFFNPAEQSIYHEWISSPPVLGIAVGVIFYLFSVVFCLTQSRKRPIFVFMLVFFLLSFGPNSTLLQFVNPFAEYRLYQSNAALAFFLAIALFKGTVVLKGRRVLGAALLFYFSAAHVLYISLWNHPITLWSYAVEKYPDSTATNVNLGNQYYLKGMCRNALRSFEVGCRTTRFINFQEICENYFAKTFFMMNDWTRLKSHLDHIHKNGKSSSLDFYSMYLQSLEHAGTPEEFQKIKAEAASRYPAEFGPESYLKRPHRECVKDEPLTE